LAGKVQAHWPPTRRSAWRPRWHGSGGPSCRATRVISRSALDAEKHSPEIYRSRFRTGRSKEERRIEQERLAKLVPKTPGQTDDAIAERAISAAPWEPLPSMVKL
jgi:hypothetical protein